MRANRRRRSGMVLILVLAMIPLLALGGYAFTHWMRAESQGAMLGWQQAQARQAARSGVEYVLSILTDTEALASGAIVLEDDAAIFANQTLGTIGGNKTAKFSIISPAPAGGFVFGLEAETKKLPIHRTSSWKMKRDGLMGLPNMTEAIADSIMDWVDSDDTAREQGAESSYYLNLYPPYKPSNTRFGSIDELLLVKGVTPALLYGEDANLDGVLNPNEDDGDASWPPDNADGMLDRGWYPYVTVYTAWSNKGSDGKKKTSLSSSKAAGKLTEAFDESIGAFFTAYKASNKNIKAVSELIDAKAAVSTKDKEGKTSLTVLDSPWKASAAGDFLDDALDKFEVSAKGLIDVNTAPPEVLRCIPGMTQELAMQIGTAAAGRPVGSIGVAWLLADSIVTLEQFKTIEAYITGMVKVYHFQSVGFFAEGGPICRIDVVVDLSKTTPKIVYQREMTGGFDSTVHQLLQGNDGSY